MTICHATNTRLCSRMQMFLAIKENYFVKQMVRHLLKSHSVVSAEKPNLSGKALYKEVLVHSQQLNSSEVDLFLQKVEDNIDVWTTGIIEEPDFRQVVHFLVTSKYLAEGHEGAVVSFKEIVYSLIPGDL